MDSSQNPVKTDFTLESWRKSDQEPNEEELEKQLKGTTARNNEPDTSTHRDDADTGEQMPREQDLAEQEENGPSNQQVSA